MNEVTLVERIRMKNVERNKEMINVEKGALEQYITKGVGGARIVFCSRHQLLNRFIRFIRKGEGGGGYTVLVGKCIQR